MSIGIAAFISSPPSGVAHISVTGCAAPIGCHIPIGCCGIIAGLNNFFISVPSKVSYIFFPRLSRSILTPACFSCIQMLNLASASSLLCSTLSNELEPLSTLNSYLLIASLNASLFISQNHWSSSFFITMFSSADSYTICSNL